MINNELKGIAMNTKELKEIVLFFKKQGISPTVKEFCTTDVYLFQYKNNKAC